MLTTTPPAHVDDKRKDDAGSGGGPSGTLHQQLRGTSGYLAQAELLKPPSSGLGVVQAKSGGPGATVAKTQPSVSSKLTLQRTGDLYYVDFGTRQLAPGQVSRIAKTAHGLVVDEFFDRVKVASAGARPKLIQLLTQRFPAKRSRKGTGTQLVQWQARYSADQLQDFFAAVEQESWGGRAAQYPEGQGPHRLRRRAVHRLRRGSVDAPRRGSRRRGRPEHDAPAQ